MYADVNKIGFIPMTELRKIVKSFKIPIEEKLLQQLFQNTESNGDGDLAYNQFITFLNWRDHPGMCLLPKHKFKEFLFSVKCNRFQKFPGSQMSEINFPGLSPCY